MLSLLLTFCALEHEAGAALCCFCKSRVPDVRRQAGTAMRLCLSSISPPKWFAVGHCGWLRCRVFLVGCQALSSAVLSEMDRLVVAWPHLLVLSGFQHAVAL